MDLAKATHDVLHALRIDAAKAEHTAARKSYDQVVRVHVPTGELVGNLAGYAWAWRMQGRLVGPLPLTTADKLNAQAVALLQLAGQMEGQVREIRRAANAIHCGREGYKAYLLAVK